MSSFGQFSHRWATMAKRLGLDVICVGREWGDGVPLVDYARPLGQDKSIKCAFGCHNENPTGVTTDLGRRQACRDGEEVMLTLTEFNLRAVLASRPGQVMGRGELLRRVWGYEVEIETRTVDAHVYRLRRKLEPAEEKPTSINSVPGIGYRFSG